ncbi:MAG: 30S ribosomal protein S15 [Candidatus Eisenbacteria bacterium]|nr:30S ribosomal protein S15 [Candidatus Eisenbacteria bacterium]
MSLTKEKKKEIVKRFETHAGDTGSAEVQIALLTERIETLSKHFELHKKDNHSRLGLLKMVGKRRRLLNYLKDQKPDGYKQVLKELGLRR